MLLNNVDPSLCDCIGLGSIYADEHRTGCKIIPASIATRNTRRLMRQYRAIYMPPPRRFTTSAGSMWRSHEYYFNV